MRQPEPGERSWPTLVLLTCGLAVAHGLVVYLLVPGVLDGSLIDPDSYTRLIRVDELWRGGGWYDSTIAAMNAPYGLELHWTRPLDVLLLLGAWSLSPAVGFDAALYGSGAFVSPVLHVVAALALVWAVGPLFAPGRRGLVVLVFLVQPLALNYAYAGRADHHMLLVLCYVLSLGFCLRALRGLPDGRAALAGGALAGLGLWVSVEFLPPLVTLYVPLAVSWVVGRPGSARHGLLFSLGWVAVVALALVIESPPAELLTAVYDRISTPHLVLAVMSLVLWAGLDRLEHRGSSPEAPGARLGLLCSVGLVALLPAVLAFPGLVESPMAVRDPRLGPLLMGQIVELQPIFPRTLPDVGTAVARLGHAVIALPFLVWRLLPRHDRESRLAWLPVVLAAAVFVPLGLYQLRFAVWAAVPIAIGVAGLLAVATGRLTGPEPARVLARAAASAGVLLLPLVLGGIFLVVWPDRAPRAARAGSGQCSVLRLATALAEGWAAEEPRVVLAHPNVGPELVYRTPHRVVAAPYHRNVAGILDAHAILAATDDRVARARMGERGVDLVALCPVGDEWFVQGVEEPERTLFTRLLAGRGPSWLQPVEDPGREPSGFRLYRVVGEG